MERDSDKIAIERPAENEEDLITTNVYIGGIQFEVTLKKKHLRGFCNQVTTDVQRICTALERYGLEDWEMMLDSAESALKQVHKNQQEDYEKLWEEAAQGGE